WGGMRVEGGMSVNVCCNLVLVLFYSTIMSEHREYSLHGFSIVCGSILPAFMPHDQNVCLAIEGGVEAEVSPIFRSDFSYCFDRVLQVEFPIPESYDCRSGFL